MLGIILNIFLTLTSVLIKTGETGNFVNAVSMTLDGKENIYVLDADKNEILKYDNNFNFIKRTGKKGWGNGEFDNPTYIDGSSGLEIYVSDSRNYRIQRFDLNLSYITSVTTNFETFKENFKFQTPVATVNISPYFYVIDGENKRIVAFQNLGDNSGVPVFAFGGFQSAQAPFAAPTKIIKDNYNNLYILDAKQNSIFIYDNFGNYVNTLTQDKIISISTVNNILYILTTDKILVFDTKTKSYTEEILFAENISNLKIKDFTAQSLNKFYILTYQKLLEYSLK